MANKADAFDALDRDEEDLIASIEDMDASFRSVLTPERRSEIESVARASFSGDRDTISLEILRYDLVKLKSRALQEGISYQSLIDSLIHKYVSD